MFNSISWTEYVGVVVLLLIAYYIFIGVKFYLSELRSLLQNKRKLSNSSATESADEVQDRTNNFQDNQLQLYPSYKRFVPQVQETDDSFQQVEELTAGLREAIAEAASKNYVKEEFILSLQILLKKYPFLKGSPFRVAINNMIVAECQKYGYVHLSAEERVILWNE